MTETVLIVEDNHYTRALATDILEFQGYKVVSTGNASQAIEMAIDHQPNIILMDLLLPEKTGFEVTRELKTCEETKHIPVVAFSALVADYEKEKALNAGCNGFISKPIDYKNFSLLIKSYVSLH